MLILFRDHFFDISDRQRVKVRRKLGFGMITSDLDPPSSEGNSAVKTIIHIWHVTGQKLFRPSDLMHVTYMYVYEIKKNSGFIGSVHLLVPIFSLSVRQTFLSQALPNLKDMACTFNIKSPISSLTLVTVDQYSRVLHLWHLLCRQGAWFSYISNTQNCCYIWIFTSAKYFPYQMCKRPEWIHESVIATLCKSAQRHLYRSVKRVWSCRCQWLKRHSLCPFQK